MSIKERTFKTIILEDLKRRGLLEIIKKIKSIRYETFSMGNALRVKTVGLTDSEHKTLTALLDEYAYGCFDGMTDYAYNVRDNAKERQAKYVTLTNLTIEEVSSEN